MRSSILDEKMIPFRIPARKIALALVLLAAALLLDISPAEAQRIARLGLRIGDL